MNIEQGTPNIEQLNAEYRTLNFETIIEDHLSINEPNAEGAVYS